MTEPLSLPPAVRRLADATLRSAGETPVALRRAVADRAAVLAGEARSEGEIPSELRAYVDKVAQYAYKTTDEDIDALRAAGWSEDALFEVTVATAVGAGLTRFEQGLAALRKAGA